MGETINETRSKVQQALTVLYNDQNNANRQAADKWLRQFQKTAEAWQVSDELLSVQGVPDFVHFFAAQTIHTKIHSDFHSQLPSNCWNALRESILSHVLRFQKGSKMTSTRLCLALTALAVQDESWKSPLAHVIACFQSSAPHCLLEIIAVLPEEVAAPYGTSSTRIRELTDELQQAIPGILNMLVTMLQLSFTPPVDKDLQKLIFGCYNNWIHYCDISPTELSSNPLLTILFDAIADEDLFDDAVDTIISILRRYDNIKRDIPVIQVIIPRIMSLKPIFLNALASENEETCRGLCGIFAEMGESYVTLIIGEVNVNQLEILDLIVKCTTYPDPEIAKITLNFWSQFTGRLCDITPEEARKSRVEAFAGALNQLAQSCVQMLHLPEGFESWLVDKQEDFSQYRQDVGDTLRDCCQLLGTSTILECCLQGLQRHHQDKNWKAIEAYLYIVRAIAREVDENENVFLPQIFSAIPHLPDHPSIQYTSILIISRYSKWLNRYENFLKPLFDYVIKGFHVQSHPSFNISSAAAMAVNSMCLNCSQNVGENVFTVYENMRSLEIRDELQLLEGICHIISDKNLNDIPGYLNRITNPIAQRLLIAIQTSSTDYLQISNEFKRLTQIFRAVQPQGISLGQNHPIAALISDLWQLFTQIVAIYGGHELIAEAVCRCFKYAMRTCQSHFIPIVEKLALLLVQSFAAFSQNSFLYCSSIIVSDFSQETSLMGVIDRMITELSKHLFSILVNVEALTNRPDAVEEYFYLMERVAKYSPKTLISCQLLLAVTQCGIVGLKVRHEEANKSILCFFEQIILLVSTDSKSVLEDPVVKDGIKQILVSEGKNLVYVMMAGILGSLSMSRVDSDHGSVAGVFVLFAKLNPSLLEEWMSSSIDQLVNPQILQSCQKNELIQNLLRARDEKAFRAILRDFGRKWRNQNFS